MNDSKSSKGIVSLKKVQVEKIIVKALSTSYYIDESKINKSTTFDQDLLSDTVTFHDALDSIEEEFTSYSYSFKIDRIERSEIETVEDLMRIVCRRVCGPAESV